jgi:hypothetical protein
MLGILARDWDAVYRMKRLHSPSMNGYPDIEGWRSLLIMLNDEQPLSLDHKHCLGSRGDGEQIISSGLLFCHPSRHMFAGAGLNRVVIETLTRYTSIRL